MRSDDRLAQWTAAQFDAGVPMCWDSTLSCNKIPGYANDSAVFLSPNESLVRQASGASLTDNGEGSKKKKKMQKYDWKRFRMLSSLKLG